MTTVAHPEGAFTWPSDDPELIGGRCDDCTGVVFPNQTSCPRCGSLAMAEHRLPRRGRLHTWTTQSFLPKEPYAGPETDETFAPWGVGLIQLGDEVRVEARLTEADPEILEFDMEVQLVIVQFREDDDATTVTFAFEPV